MRQQDPGTQRYADDTNLSSDVLAHMSKPIPGNAYGGGNEPMRSSSSGSYGQLPTVSQTNVAQRQAPQLAKDPLDRLVEGL